MSILSEILKKIKKSQPLNSPLAGYLIQVLIPTNKQYKIMKSIEEIRTAIDIARMYSPELANSFKNADDFLNQIEIKIKSGD